MAKSSVSEHSPVLLALLFCLLASMPLLAQYSQTWNTFLSATPGTGEDLFLTADGNVAVCGSTTPMGESNSSCFTVRIDNTGTELWHSNTFLDSIGFLYRILPLADGGSFSVGQYEDHTGTDNLVGFRHAADGSLLSTTVVNTPGTSPTGDEFHDADQDDQGNIYLTGEFAYDLGAAAGLVKLDPQGNFQWQVLQPPTLAQVFGQGYAVACVGDTLIYVLARNAIGCSLLRYSAVGDLLGSTDLAIYLEGNRNTLVVDGEGNAVFGGSHTTQFNLTKISPDGTVLWNNDFSFPGLSASSYITNVACDVNGNIYAAGSAGNQQFGAITAFSPAGSQNWADTTEAFIVSSYLSVNKDRMLLHGDHLTLATYYTSAHLYEYDTLGNRLFRQVLEVDGDAHVHVNAMRKADNGDLYISGLHTTSGQGFLAKLATDMGTDIQENAPGPLSLYPDPCDAILLLSGALDGAAVQVLDMEGHNVLRSTVHGGQLDVNALRPGAYMLRMDDGRIWRFVKVHH